MSAIRENLNVDSTFLICDDTDSTKQLKFDISAITTATTRTWTIPNIDSTFVGTSNTQTLTNKTINTANNTLNIAAADISSGTLNNSRISVSNITQHEGSINHDNLLGFVANEHINWLTDQGANNIHQNNITATSITQHEGSINISNLSGAPTGQVVGISDTQTLTNKTLTDSTTFFQDNLDTTKKIQFQLSGVTTGNTRILTVPNANTTLIGSSSGSSTNNSIPRFDGTTGNIIKTSGALIDDSNNLTVGDATSGTIYSTKELVLREDGDTYGSSILRLRNRTAENGAIFETTDVTAALVDFIFKSSSDQRNIRYESRSSQEFIAAPEFQFGSSGDPTLVVNDSKILVRGNIDVTGTVDGRNLSTDGSNLDSHVSATSAHGVSGSIVGTSDSQTLTNKTINADSNTITNIDNLDIKAAAAIDATKIADGSVTNAEFQYINSVTSNVQTQLNGKAASSHNHATSDITSGTLSVSQGGSGATTHTTNSVLKGNGTSAIISSNWLIDSDNCLSVATNVAGFILDIHNTAPSGGNGFHIHAGEVAGDLAFKITDRDGTFSIMEMEANNGYIVTHKTYAQALSDNGVVFGFDNQHSGNAKDFNTQFGAYRIGGNIALSATDLGTNVVNSSLTKVGTIGTGVWQGTVVDVAYGGTGVASLTSGKILRGNGTGAITSTLTAPSGTIVGTSDTQTITNKTFGDSLNMNSNKIINLATPTANTDAANKAYVDSISSGLDIKDSVVVASTVDLNSNASISGTITYNSTTGSSSRGQITATLVTTDTFTVDSVNFGAAQNGSRILLMSQTDGAQNGIWTTTISGTSLTLDRATDFDSDAEVTSGAFMFIEQGTTYDNKGFVLSTNNPIIIGGASGTSLEFTQFSGAGGGTVNAGSGMTKSGDTLNVIGSATIIANADHLEVNSSTTANQVLLSSGSVGTAPTYGQLPLGDSNAVTGTLPVSKGGIGATTLSSGKILQGNGTGEILATLTAPSGAIVGTTDTQVLTNKTINSASNTIIIAATDITSGTLPVSRGGSGTTSLTSGKILQGNGTGTVLATLTAPSGAIVGISDTQVLTNKTINTSSNTITIAATDITSGTLPVSRGGSGATTLTSGKILQGNGTGAILAALTAPSGAIVGISDTQTLTNKTITSTTNNVTAKGLHSATTTVSVSGATAPTSGQVLTATGSTTATWQTPTTKTIRQAHTWAICGEIKVASGDTNFLVPMYISLASGQTAKLVSCKHKINSGTSVSVKVQKNDVDVTGFTGISVTQAATNTDPADVALADGDELSIIVSSPSGTPKNMTFTIFIEHTI